MTVRKFFAAMILSSALFVSACDLAEDQVSEPVVADASELQEQACGGIAGLACGDGEYCQFAEGECHIADNMGICQPVAEICTMDYRPVCSCDGKTYSNACGAAAAGVSVERQGMCAKG